MNLDIWDGFNFALGCFLFMIVAGVVATLAFGVQAFFSGVRQAYRKQKEEVES